ncbi:tail fiber protein [Vibrio splendidus]|uniref:tail fiber protein n=1 Tax=Vibrio splendidus TaxID=29497 RepID=UPI00114C8EDC|nr:tail fiber protein [Vibrio splendidus]
MRINKWMCNLTPIAAIIGVFSSVSATASCSTDPFIGSMCVTAADFCPEPYYMKAEGQYLPINEWQALFSYWVQTLVVTEPTSSCQICVVAPQ